MSVFALLFMSALCIAEDIKLSLDNNLLEVRKEGSRFQRIELVSFNGLKTEIFSDKSMLRCTKKDRTSFTLFSILKKKVTSQTLIFIPVINGKKLTWSLITSQGFSEKPIDNIRVFLHSLMFYEYQQSALEKAKRGKKTNVDESAIQGASYKGFLYFQKSKGTKAEALFFISEKKQPHALLGPYWGPDASVAHCFEKVDATRSLVVLKLDQKGSRTKCLITLDYHTQTYSERVVGKK